MIYVSIIKKEKLIKVIHQLDMFMNIKIAS